MRVFNKKINVWEGQKFCPKSYLTTICQKLNQNGLFFKQKKTIQKERQNKRKKKEKTIWFEQFVDSFTIKKMPNLQIYPITFNERKGNFNDWWWCRIFESAFGRRKFRTSIIRFSWVFELAFGRRNLETMLEFFLDLIVDLVCWIKLLYMF